MRPTYEPHNSTESRTTQGRSLVLSTTGRTGKSNCRPAANIVDATQASLGLLSLVLGLAGLVAFLLPTLTVVFERAIRLRFRPFHEAFVGV